MIKKFCVSKAIIKIEWMNEWMETEQWKDAKKEKRIWENKNLKKTNKQNKQKKLSCIYKKSVHKTCVCVCV